MTGFRLASLLAAMTLAIHGQERAAPDWAGTWKGTLRNLPPRANAPAVEVVRELEPLPTKDQTCAQFRTSYFVAGKLDRVKDYRLCRGQGPDDLFVDEGDGVKLTARLLGDLLVSPFKVGQLLLVSTMRVRGDLLEEEILTADDQPATAGVVALRPRGVQRLELRRTAKADGRK